MILSTPMAAHPSDSTTNTERQMNPSAANNTGLAAGMSATDPLIIQAITQTMIGEHLWKYTRKVGGGTSERKHCRFFWIHPYTKTIYWSNKAPGADGNTMRDATAKSSHIKSVRVALDPTQTDGLSAYILIISTPGRELKVRAENDDRHAVWLRALSYLQSRPTAITPGSLGPSTINTRSQEDFGNIQRGEERSTTEPTSPPISKVVKQKRSLTNLFNKRSQSNGNMPKAEIPPPPPMPKILAVTALKPPQNDGFYNYGGSVNNNDVEDDENDEELENVRACCGGKHDLGKLCVDH